MKIRKNKKGDRQDIIKLHHKVSLQKGGIARSFEEIDATYIDKILEINTKGGLGIVAYADNILIAEIHATKYAISIFDHVLTFLTIVVHPDYQGKGYGKKLFIAFLEEIQNHRKDIWRVELEARATNTKSRKLYESIGFQYEGTLKNKARNTDGSYEDSIAYAWFNKNYKQD